MSLGDRITLLWHGAAHYHIYYRNLTIIIDPLYTRLPGDKPHLEAIKEDLDRVEYLLLTHGHLDHSWDFPHIAAKHDPETYAPAECLLDIPKEEVRLGRQCDRLKWQSLEEIKGTTFKIADIDVTPFQIGTEEIDFWFIRSMFIRPWLHGAPRAVATGFKWMRHHLYGNCFAFHFRFSSAGKTMLYFGNLTGQVDELNEIERVNVLAIPYCPANKKWLRQSQYLIDRFKPDVTMVHHFDNFMNPYTQSKYMNLDNYRTAVHAKCPDVKFYFSKFYQEVDFAEMAGMPNEILSNDASP
ncbi:MAG: MBL fold metallo-hydrolase [Candidatus Hydrogenedentota bacterium]|nr:MAG: MBL fold metallo-hydrolase [Candidatus Hydrogenedentota bacterium]